MLGHDHVGSRCATSNIKIHQMSATTTLASAAANSRNVIAIRLSSPERLEASQKTATKARFRGRMATLLMTSPASGPVHQGSRWQTRNPAAYTPAATAQGYCRLMSRTLTYGGRAPGVSVTLGGDVCRGAAMPC